MSGPLVGVLIGWFLHGHANPSSDPTALQQQMDHICEIDRRISSALASLHAYEERLRIGAQLSENGSASTKPCSIGSGTDDLGMGLGRSPLREPLDGKTLLDIKQATDNHIRECTSALTRATAVLEEDTIRGAQELVDALVNTRATLEAQETNGEASSEAMGSCVAALHTSRSQFLNTARARLGLDALTEETEGRIEALTEKAFSPSHLSRPYVAAGVRLPEERR
ncbi:MAG: hypothetical protein V5A58_07290 [Salinibacter sp.]|uniref:hypothetical protein n=1 Tax=Salinibacter sp. TaxID=2065818 RepID=UPI002FC38782